MNIKRTFQAFCALLFFLNSFFSTAQTDDIVFSQFTKDDGLINNSVRLIYKDSQFYLWFVTYDGISRFDGYDFRSFTYTEKDTNSINSFGVRCIFEDSKNNLWFGGHHGLARFDYEKEAFVCGKFRKRVVTSMVESNDGIVWMGTSDGIILFNANDNTFSEFTQGKSETDTLSSQSVDYLLKNQHGDIIIVYSGSAVDIFSPKTRQIERHIVETPANAAPSLNEVTTRAVLVDNKNIFWHADDKGLIHYDLKTKESIFYPTNLNLGDKSLNNTWVFDMVSFNDNQIWLATDGGGINVFDKTKETFSYIKGSDGDNKTLSSPSPICFYKDEFKGIWVGTVRGGVNYYNKFHRRFGHHRHKPNKPNSLSHNNIYSFTESKDGKIWIGTDGGGLNCWDKQNNTFTTYKHSDKDPNTICGNIIASVLEDNYGNILVGSYFQGLCLLNRTNNRWKPLSPDNTYAGLTGWCSIKDSNNEIWVGMIDHRGLALFDDENHTFTVFKHDPSNAKSLTNSNIDCIIESKDKKLWIGTHNGLNCMDLNTREITPYYPNTDSQIAIPEGRIWTICEDSKGNIWFAAENKGLFCFDLKNKSLKSYTVHDGLPNNSVWGILADDHNNLWISTNEGIAKFSIDDQSFRNFSKSDGLQSNQFSYNAFFKDSKGLMYFGGINGFNVFHPDSVIDNPDVPQVHITKLKVFNKTVNMGDTVNDRIILEKSISSTNELTLTHKENVFSLDFVGINYLITEKNKFAYLLEGLEKNWNYTYARFATYTNLDAGEYTFKVKAANSDGVWSKETTSLKIIILPPWWETWWFKLSGILFVLGSAIIFFLVRIKQIKARQLILEKLVQERTYELSDANANLEEQQAELEIKQEEILAQNEEISTHRDELERQNEQIQGSIRYAQTIQQAILPVEDILDKHLDSFIFYRPKDIVSGDFYWHTEVKEENYLFYAVVDCTGHGVPGAFMSMIGNRALEEIVNRQKIYQPKEILERMHVYIVEALKQNKCGKRNDDGMDVCLCRISNGTTKQTEVSFAGAKRPLIYYSKFENQIKTIKGSVKSVGGTTYDRCEFTEHNVEFQKGDILYLTTDGYIDQPDPNRKRFGSKKLMDLLVDIAVHNLEKQKECLDKTFETYKDDAYQRDDITMMGLKL